MSKALKASEPFLHLLARSSARRRKALLSQVTKAELSSLCEICLNILQGNVPLDDKTYNRLKRHRQKIRTLADKSTPVAKKRQVVNQHGGFIGSLVAYALPLLTSLLGR